MIQLTPAYFQEERLVAELEKLGVAYLSRLTVESIDQIRAPDCLLSDLIQQPSSRVRTAVIALLLAHPDYANAMPAALKRLDQAEKTTLKLFYTAAVWLQRLHAARLQTHIPASWQWLPDLYSEEIGLSPQQAPEQMLRQLAQIHRQHSGLTVNWAGTYENVLHHLLRRWELEKQWNYFLALSIYPSASLLNAALSACTARAYSSSDIRSCGV